MTEFRDEAVCLEEKHFSWCLRASEKVKNGINVIVDVYCMYSSACYMQDRPLLVLTSDSMAVGIRKGGWGLVVVRGLSS